MVIQLSGGLSDIVYSTSIITYSTIQYSSITYRLIQYSVAKYITVDIKSILDINVWKQRSLCLVSWEDLKEEKDLKIRFIIQICLKEKMQSGLNTDQWCLLNHNLLCTLHYQDQDNPFLKEISISFVY